MRSARRQPRGVDVNEEIKARLMGLAVTDDQVANMNARRHEEFIRQGRNKLTVAIGSRYFGCRLSNFLIDQNDGDPSYAKRRLTAVKRLGAYQDQIDQNINQGSNLLILGPCGTGKDHLLAATMYGAIESGYGVEWSDGLGLQARFRRAFASTEPGATDMLLRSLVSPDVLAISDPVPPTSRSREWADNMLFQIIDSRYRHSRPTWITANIGSRAEADELLGAPVADRLRHNAVTIECFWPSFRKVQHE